MNAQKHVSVMIHALASAVHFLELWPYSMAVSCHLKDLQMVGNLINCRLNGIITDFILQHMRKVIKTLFAFLPGVPTSLLQGVNSLQYLSSFRV